MEYEKLCVIIDVKMRLFEIAINVKSEVEETLSLARRHLQTFFLFLFILLFQFSDTAFPQINTFFPYIYLVVSLHIFHRLP